MDPIVCAARRFLTEVASFWEAGQGRVLRMAVSDEDRGELVKALRIAELSPENRWPTVVYEAPFMDPSSYLNGLCEQIARDCELVRKGAAEEGVTLAPFSVGATQNAEGLDAVGRAAVHIERAAALLGERLSGVLVALVPVHVSATARWKECIARLATAPFSPKARLAVVDSPGGPLETVLGAQGARFAIDQAALLAYTRGLAEGACRAREGSEDGAPDGQRALRSLLLDAAEHARQGEPAAAVDLYRRALAVCQTENLAVHEAGVRMALAGTFLAAGDAPAALENYEKAADLGVTTGALPIVCQARLGAGGVCFAFTRYELAAQLYELAGEAAKQAKIPLLRIEALRMAGTCHVLRGAKEDALIAWAEALNAGIGTNRLVRQVSTLEQAAKELRSLLADVGLSRHADEIGTYLQELSTERAERRESACS